MNILSLVLGILLVIGGVWCTMSPIATFASLGWLFGIIMLVEGFGNALTWNERRRDGVADGWSLLAAVLSAILGIILIISGVARFAIDTFFTYLISAWLIASGAMRIASALRLRAMRKVGAPIGGSWGILLVIGILVTIAGVFCLFHPILTMAGFGVYMGIGIISTGFTFIAAAFLR